MSEPPRAEADDASVTEADRDGVLSDLESWLERPMIVLGLLWLALLVVELAWGLGRGLQLVATIIWAVFVGEFALRFALAPAKLRFVRRNWLTAISLILPALRFLRVFRAARVLRLARFARGSHLVRIVASVNRAMNALGAALSRSKFSYVIASTVIVVLAGAAGMRAFEGGDPRGLGDYGTALWWTAMLMTTMGSEYWPRTAEGRLLCLTLAIYAFAVFGYVTATIATFLIGSRAEPTPPHLSTELSELRREVRELRELLERSVGERP